MNCFSVRKDELVVRTTGNREKSRICLGNRPEFCCVGTRYCFHSDNPVPTQNDATGWDKWAGATSISVDRSALGKCDAGTGRKSQAGQICARSLRILLTVLRSVWDN